MLLIGYNFLFLHRTLPELKSSASAWILVNTAMFWQLYSNASFQLSGIILTWKSFLAIHLLRASISKTRAMQ